MRLFLHRHCLCVFLVRARARVCVCHLRFILPPEVQRSLAILKVRDDTVGEGSVITATPPSPPLSIFPSLHLPFHVFSLLCGSWYVDFIKFSPGWVTEKTGGGSGESSPLCCFHLSFLFHSHMGTLVVGFLRWKGSPGTCALSGRRAS